MGRNGYLCLVSGVFRGLLVTFAGALLAFITIAAWNHGQIQNDESSGVDIATGSPWLQADGEALTVDLGKFGDSDGLHLRFILEAEMVEAGTEAWQDGRMHLEWRRDGNLLNRVFLASVKGTESFAEPSTLITEIPDNATARLHLENLGLAGRIRLAQFEAFPTKNVDSARFILSLTGLGWFIWAAFVAGSPRKPRSWIAALVWVIGIWFLAVPGPWPMRSPLLGNFAMGVPDQVRTISPEEFEDAPTQPGIIESPNLLIRWKIRLQPLRPLLHGALFFVPTVGLLACCLSTSRALILATLLAISVEWAQWAFGYGFALEDVVDLATNAAGIAAAWLVFRIWRAHLKPGRVKAE